MRYITIFALFISMFSLAKASDPLPNKVPPPNAELCFGEGHFPYLRKHPDVLLYCAYKRTLPSFKDNAPQSNDFTLSFKWPFSKTHLSDIPVTTWRVRVKEVQGDEGAREALVILCPPPGTLLSFCRRDFQTFLERSPFGKIPIYAIEGLPNEPLSMGGKQRTGHNLISYSWKRAIEANPYANVSVAMTVAAMHALVKLASKIELHVVFLAGAVARGQTARSLLSLNSYLYNTGVIHHNERILMHHILTVDSPLLNTYAQFEAMYKIYGHKYPASMKDYIHNLGQYLPPHAHSSKFEDLMRVSDPYTYLDVPNLAKAFGCASALALETGRSFLFPPDNQLRFHKKIDEYTEGCESAGKGVKRHVVYNYPNAQDYQSDLAHIQIPSPLLVAFASSLLYSPMSSLGNASSGAVLHITTSQGGLFEKIAKIQVYKSISPNRDFRFGCGASKYTALEEMVLPEPKRSMDVPLPRVPEGQWGSFTVKVTGESNLTLFTPFYVLPQNKYPAVRPVSNDPNCGLVDNP